jgi:hypothetical protein
VLDWDVRLEDRQGLAEPGCSRSNYAVGDHRQPAEIEAGALVLLRDSDPADALQRTVARPATADRSRSRCSPPTRWRCSCASTWVVTNRIAARSRGGQGFS